MPMGKIFYSKFKLLIFHSCLIAAIAFFCLTAPMICAQQQTHYKTYDPKTGVISNHFYTTIEKILSGGYKVHWVSEEGNFKVEEEYVLGPDHETLWWHVVDDQREINYIGERKENKLLIDGKFSGVKISKTIQLDDKAFYYNPKFGLVDFVRSGKKSGVFWGFRQDELKAYPMKAINKGEEVISVDGDNVEAIKVYWTVNDFRSTFFKRVYWFRKSDGMYVKQEVSGGKFRELVSEQ